MQNTAFLNGTILGAFLGEVTCQNLPRSTGYGFWWILRCDYFTIPQELMDIVVAGALERHKMEALTKRRAPRPVADVDHGNINTQTQKNTPPLLSGDWIAQFASGLSCVPWHPE
jgi:hypothetical protein